MVDPPSADIVSLNVRIAPCTNRCRHCWAQGTPRRPVMPLERIAAVLDEFAALCHHGREPGLFFLLDEPTNHPAFLAVLEHASQAGLLREEFFLPTNGHILAHAPNEDWARLRQAGLAWLQLTLYGLGPTHDAFAGRRGAFDDVVAAARRALDQGLGWWAQVVLHAGNVGELARTLDYARALDPSGRSRVGWFPFAWQGRGRRAPRVRGSQYASLPPDLQHASILEERRAVERILADPQLSSRTGGEAECEALVLEVGPDLEVSCGGACDSGGIAGAVPEMHREFALGRLGDGGFPALLERLEQQPPRPLAWLREVTWGELAARYGDRTSDEVYRLDDLPQHKWAAAYLRERARLARQAPGS